MIRPSTPVARLFGLNRQAPALAQRMVRDAAGVAGDIEGGIITRRHDQGLATADLEAPAKVDGLTFCVDPHEVIVAAARAGVLGSNKLAAVSEAAVNSTCAINW